MYCTLEGRALHHCQSRLPLHLNHSVKHIPHMTNRLGLLLLNVSTLMMFNSVGGAHMAFDVDMTIPTVPERLKGNNYRTIYLRQVNIFLRNLSK